jgi:MoaA/NifB/PqqE/SkfB family radical SAM enzyme
VSLDGPEPVHDRYRAAGSFARVIRVLEDAGRDRLPVILNPVVSRATLPHLDDLVDLARRYNAILKFQPINHLPAGNRNILDLMLDGDQYGSLSARLGELKMRTRVVGNTHSGIRYLGCLPGGGPMKCFAGRLFVYLAPDGNLFPCNRRQEVAEPQSCAEAPVSHALRNLPRVECRTCWCTSDAELNLMMRLDPRDVFGSFRMAVERGI